MANVDAEADVCMFITDLVAHVYRHYINSNILELPIAIPLPLLSRYEDRFTCTRNVGEYLIYLCDTLREHFVPLCQQFFPISCASDESFLRYCITCCSQLRHSQLFDGEEFLLLEDPNNMAFLISCAFILEYALLSFQRGCYRYTTLAKDCIIAIYNRYFSDILYLTNDWLALELFCEKKLIQRSQNMRNDPNVEFRNRSILGNILATPLERCVHLNDEDVELNETEERMIPVNTIGLRYMNIRPCQWCFYNCFEHMNSFLLLVIPGTLQEYQDRIYI